LKPTNDGENIDFHSLRHACGAWLAMSGAHPKVIQTIMRHSTITLTMDTYGHLFPGQEADAVADMGKLMTTAAALRATETVDVTADPGNDALQYAQQLGRETRRTVATGCNREGNPERRNGENEDRRYPLKAMGFSASLRILAKESKSSRGGTRTRTP